jgi:hypothetical protein
MTSAGNKLFLIDFKIAVKPRVHVSIMHDSTVTRILHGCNIAVSPLL